MIILDKFTLLKDVPNVLHLSENVLKANSVRNANDTVKSIMGIMEKRITHFATKPVFKYVKKGKFHIVYTPSYNLPVSYNIPTKGIVINLASFNVRDVTPTNPSPRDLYACFAYGICFMKMVTGKAKFPDKFSSVISTYLMTVFFRIFGKEYGLLGRYSTQIPKLKFLTSCYINASFCGIKGDSNYRRASMETGIDYRDVKSQLDKFKFDNIDDFINALSDFKVFPGISKYHFTSKLLKMLTINFLPAIEDCSRFTSVLTASSVPGVTFIPSALIRYNEDEFDKVMKISQTIFSR